MSKKEEFYTLKGYQSQEPGGLTTAMEDYLEMICRIAQEQTSVRAGTLSKKLHVKPPSATKMIQQLSRAGYLQAEKYGFIYLTEKGWKAGLYLLYRHEVTRRFLCTLNKSLDQLEQVEKIEHFLDRTTVENLDGLTRFLNNESDHW